jgi:hypothetical protein
MIYPKSKAKITFITHKNVHSDQKTCGKDGVYPQGAFVKQGGYAFSTFSMYNFFQKGFWTSLIFLKLNNQFMFWTKCCDLFEITPFFHIFTRPEPWKGRSLNSIRKFPLGCGTVLPSCSLFHSPTFEQLRRQCCHLATITPKSGQFIQVAIHKLQF